MVCAVFGATGSSALYIMRPLLATTLGIEGSLVDGPNSYRLASLLLMSPAYATVLLLLGTLSGRHTFFAKMAFGILKRYVPARSLQQRLLCKPARLKQSSN